MLTPKELSDQLDQQQKYLANLKRQMHKIAMLDEDRTGNLSKIEKSLSVLTTTLDEDRVPLHSKDVLNAWVDQFEKRLAQTRQDLDIKFGSQLAELLRDANVRVTGSVPELRAGIFTVELDSKRDRAVLWYGPRQERIENLNKSPQAVASFVRKTLHTLSTSVFEDESFVKECFESYRRALHHQKGSIGDRVPITTVLAEQAFLRQAPKFFTDPRRENYQTYGRLHFSFDLYRLKTRNVKGLELRLITATRSQTSNRKNFLWVPHGDHGDGAVYSHVQFLERAR
jgi:hypothetical protein